MSPAGAALAAAAREPAALAKLDNLRLDRLDYRPDPRVLQQAWRSLADELAQTSDDAKRGVVIRSLKRAGRLYTWQSWNFEYQHPSCWLDICAANHALYAHAGRLQLEPEFERQQVSLALVQLRRAAWRMAEQFPQREPDSAIAYYREYVPAGPTTWPRLASDRGNPLHTWWGDLQVHSALSYDAFLSPVHCLRFAADVMGFDFAALTDHDVLLGSDAHPFLDTTVERGFELLGQAAALSPRPSFTALAANEWGGRFAQGHRHILFDEGDSPRARYAVTGEHAGSITRLWQTLRADGTRALTIPHHTGFAENAMGNDLRHYDPAFERLIEIVSDNGDFEFADTPLSATAAGKTVAGRTVSDALRRGLRLGIVGGSDCHTGTPGLYIPKVTGYGGRPGFTAVLARSNSRKDIFDALRARRCYATDGVRIGLAFSINGHPMGSEITVPVSEKLVIDAAVTAATPIARVALLRNEEIIETVTPDAADARIRHEIPGDESGRSRLVTASRSGRTADQFRVRVELANSHRAWASPVWVDYAV